MSRPGSRAWKLAHIEILKDLHRRGRSVDLIAFALNRSISSIQTRISRMGLSANKKPLTPGARWISGEGAWIIRPKRERSNDPRSGHQEKADLRRAARIASSRVLTTR